MNDVEKPPAENPPRISRRQFLKSAAGLAAGTFLAACGVKSNTGRPAPFRTATPARQLPLPVGTVPAGTGVPADSISLDQFLALSSVLTGVDNLEPGLGQIYLEALRAGASSGPSLAEVYSAASSGSNPPQDVQSLQQAGFFDRQGFGDLADTITTMWYTGTYELDGETHVVTAVDALAWKVLHFTKPITTCGHFGFWAEEPQVDISPQVSYTPVPTPAEGK